MKTISLYIFIVTALVKTAFSFRCEDVYLDSKETLYKAISLEKVEDKKVYTSTDTVEYSTWYIDPCRSVEKQPEDSKIKCPSNSKVCLIKSIEFKGEKEKIYDIKGYAVSDPPQDPLIKQGDYILNFEGEKNSGYTTEITFTCAGNKGTPEVTLDEDNKKVSIKYKGICVSDSKTEPTDDNKNKDDNSSSSGHFFIRFIFIIIFCYFVIGSCYNFFVLNKKGIEIIPNIELWTNLITVCYDKITEFFGRRGYSPIQI
ncbi:hypothetical protein BCR36DRAFT_582731 [Piromyces finnis]|uniref:Autophagy-related protein 27 n=1 Tax=Piromyces finnis TaxID=1754191 RepID=A0A1Y1VC47_9FUNG|nr:hypothetical protein BCR36DRAFT_582731 [Piromyces finnis]|eukprot:ORX52230.1 hypothetical protein BCR36DRAFT_582731 [Piromyces finnis]